jgi:hypothetical protein
VGETLSLTRWNGSLITLVGMVRTPVRVVCPVGPGEDATAFDYLHNAVPA